MIRVELIYHNASFELQLVALWRMFSMLQALTND